MNKGTPKTLKQAIANAAESYIEIAPIDDALIEITRLHVKDFLSQKFSVAFMMADSDEESIRLKRLWEKIIEQDT